MYILKVLGAVSCILILIISATAAPPTDQQSDPLVTQSRSIDNETFINANRILMFVTNHGTFGRDLFGVFGYDFGTFYPFETIEQIEDGSLAKTVLYSAGLWVGGIVDNSTRVTVAEYSDEYVPGPMAGGSFQPDNPAFRVYKLYRDSLEDHPNSDYLNWPVDQGAPIDDEGRPQMLGDQMLWAVYNDADAGAHNNDGGSTAPLGIEVHQTTWAYCDGGNVIVPGVPEIDINHVGNSPGSLFVQVVDPGQFTEHQYAVTFNDHPDLGSSYNIIDLTTMTTILSNETNQSGYQTHTFDGLQIRVFGGRIGVKPWDQYCTGDTSLWGWTIPNGERRFSWAGGANNFDWEGFQGALGWGGPGDTHGFGSFDPVPATSLPRVLLKLAPVDADGNFDINHPDVSFAYRYGRNFSADPAHPEFAPWIINPGSYSFQDFNLSCPLSAWNIDVDPPQRLVLGYLENNTEGGLVDGKYWPPWYVDADNTAGSGPREWLWIFLDEYSQSVNPAYTGNAIDDPMPIMYWATWARRTEDAWQDEDEFLIKPTSQYYNTPADTFFFTATMGDSAGTGSESMAIYIKYKIYNKGDNQIEDMYLSMWADIDLGEYTDDLVGCDTMLDLMFAYNGGPSDIVYGMTPPAIGFRFLNGPVVPATFEDTAFFDGVLMPGYRNLGMTSFQKYINGTDPDNFIEAYNYMRGLNADGSPLPNGTNYAVPGDPVSGFGDIDFNPGDRRMMGTCGPITMNPGDSQYVLIKMAVGQGEDYLNSVDILKYILAAPPPAEPSAMIAVHNPVVFNVFMLNALEPITGVYTVGYAAPGPAGKDIDFSSVVFSSLPSVDSITTAGFEPGFEGIVGRYYFSMTDLLAPHAGLWDSVVVPNTISGTYLDGEPFSFDADIVIYGRTPGDFDLSGQIDISDLVAMIEYYFEDGPAPVDPAAIDVDGNGEGDISDLILLIEYMF